MFSLSLCAFLSLLALLFFVLFSFSEFDCIVFAIQWCVSFRHAALMT